MHAEGIIKAVCISPEKGTVKTNVGRAEIIENYGLRDDAHAGTWHRQVSLLQWEQSEAFKAQGAPITAGSFGENLLVSGIDFKALPVGTRLRCGAVVLEITQIGKECHKGCAIRDIVGDCIMPREGVFARVLSGGAVAVGDRLVVLGADDA